MGRILVADDDANIQAVLRYRLEAAGHRVLLASDGAETLDLIASEAPDAIVLDLMMPIIDGIQVLETLAADDHLNRIPVLVLTARVDKAAEVRLYGKPVMEKPFSPREVTERIENLLALAPSIPLAEL
jgi:DNA-binding response OmpR family regulator